MDRAAYARRKGLHHCRYAIGHFPFWQGSAAQQRFANQRARRIDVLGETCDVHA